MQRELPAQQLRDRRHRGLGDRHVAEGAEHRDAGGLRVVALRLGADDRLLDPAGAPFEDLPVLVDEEVVADVVPAVGVAVVLGDAEHHRGRLVGRVVVGGDRVMDEGHLHDAVVGRRARRHRVGAPRGARDDRRRRARAAARPAAWGWRPPARRGDRRPAAGTATKCTRSAPRSAPRGAQLQLVAATGPDRIGGALAGAGVGRVVAVDGQRHPRAPVARRDGARAPRSARARHPGRARRAGRSAAARAAPGSWHPRNPRARRPCRSRVPVPAHPCPRALNGRASSDPRPAAAPRTRARRRVIVVPPTAARVARCPEGATPARSPATRLGLAGPARVAVP